MTSAEPNPYVSPVDRKPLDETSSYGQAIARIFSLGIFSASLLPTLYILYGLSVHYDFLLAHPHRSYRPLLIVFGLPLSIVTVFLLAIAAVIFTVLGCEKDAALILNLGIPLSILPFALSILGPLVICLLTGASLGS
ncbi:hypothetical protein DTL42_24930 [Bremerella cremea]|uniref:Uncharacterized protein n=1 Tax=Bremerella cremea TaxID=1031537 RepID=A0A368KLH3_9BACT|nr:hypothetical protein [Bremerella cremea]RCS40618.1 hypothetical protein DTL42_24930 [Bremerella cremea]